MDHEFRVADGGIAGLRIRDPERPSMENSADRQSAALERRRVPVLGRTMGAG
jgi:hypothetical protein